MSTPFVHLFELFSHFKKVLEVVIGIDLEDLRFTIIDSDQDYTLLDSNSSPFKKCGGVEACLDEVTKIININVVRGVPVPTTLR